MKNSQLAVIMTIALYLALALGALVNRRDSLFWVTTIYSATAFFMATATVMAFIETGRQKTAWTGFAVFGWAYLLLLFRRLWDPTAVELATTWIIPLVYEPVPTFRSIFPNVWTLDAVCHSVFTIISGLIGARLACSLSAATSARQEDRGRPRRTS